MNKDSSDFFALRSALKRERNRCKELLNQLEAERARTSELNCQIEDDKARLSELEARLSESDCTAKRQIEELEAVKKERNELDKQVAFIKSDGLWELVSCNDDIKKQIICEYLEALPSGISLISSKGYAALTPVHKPKSLADAKRIAQRIIKE